MYSTKFEDDTEITPYLAIAYIEGLPDGENASEKDQLHAWSYLCGSKVGYSLQGSFGRTLFMLIDNGYLDENGNILKEI